MGLWSKQLSFSMLLKPLSVFNHVERGFFYGPIIRPQAPPAKRSVCIPEASNLLISSKICRHSWRNCKCEFGPPDFTTRYARGIEDTERDYSFPLPGHDGKGKPSVDKRWIRERANLAARRAENFCQTVVSRSGKNTTSLCPLCLCGDYFFKTQTMSNYLWPP